VTAPRPSARQIRIAERIQRAQAERERLKDLSSTVAFRGKGAKKASRTDRDRIVLLVRDSIGYKPTGTSTAKA
jgi:hypothetical protein